MNQAPNVVPEARGNKYLFLWLAPGVTHLNANVFLYCAFATIGLLTFISTGTSLVLNANLGIPVEEQGGISGNLVIVTELGQFLIFGIAGVLADRFGRRELAAAGMFIMGISYLLYPYAETVGELTAYRFIYAIGMGASTGMLQTIVSDYPAESSRGRLVALSGAFNGLGVIVVQ